MTPVLLFAFAFIARAVAGMVFPDPAYPDSYYYVNLARALAAGEGFELDYIWSFVEVGGRLPVDPTLPIPSNAHWMPLAALVQVPFIWLLGPVALASGLPFWLAGAVAAPLAWVIARDARLSSRAAVGAGLLTAAPGAAAPFLSQPDNFALYMTLGALALWLCARGLQGNRAAFAVGGLVVGLATLARNDGVLLGVPFALAFAADLVRRPRASRIGWTAALACAAGFALVVGPWLVRQLSVFGSLSPSAASGRILWISEYRDLFSTSRESSLATFLAQGMGPLVESRLGGLAAAVGIYALVPLVGILAPLLAVGAWVRRRDVRFRPFLIYAVTLFAFSGLLFSVHVPHGMFLHSAVALLPHSFVLAVIGLEAAVRWAAARRPTWHAPTATRTFIAAAVGIVLAAALVQIAVVAAKWDADRTVRRQLAAALPAAGVSPGDRLMSPDPGGYRYYTGLGGIVTPEDPLPVIEDALRAYGVRWLALERDHVVEALAPVLEGSVRPPWLSEPLVTIPVAADGSGSPDRAAGDATSLSAETGHAPRAVLYAVCLAPDDERCGS